MENVKKNFIYEKEYKKILELMPICCVDLVIHKNNKVLLVLRKNKPAKTEWWIPGGRIYKNEKLKEAIIRKAREELGLEIDIEKNIGTYETLFEDGPFEGLISGIHTINVTFLVKPKKNQKINIDESISEFKWINKIEENLCPYIKEVLKDSKIFEKNDTSN